MTKKWMIVGGNFNNKGAQAMTFTVINEIRKRDSAATICMVSSSDYNKDNQNYNINFLPQSLFTLLYSAGGVYKLLSKIGDKLLYPLYLCLRSRERTNYFSITSYQQELDSTDYIIDISGFALSSKWGFLSSLQYMLRIISAQKHNIPFYILPQSFGPFNYSKKDNFIIKHLMKKYLPYPKVIFAREQEGYDALQNIVRLPNLKLSPDLVLQSTEIRLENIYTKLPQFTDINIKNSSIALIPNLRITDRIKGQSIERLLQLYKIIIDNLLTNGKTVYLLIHAGEDAIITTRIKELYLDEERVINVPEELNCFEFEKFIEECDFAIASRYHAIVHSYKKGVPCMVFGWAVKYDELTRLMSQERYYHDMRSPISMEKVTENLEFMLQNHSLESKIIKEKLSEIQRHSCFENLFKV